MIFYFSSRLSMYIWSLNLLSRGRPLSTCWRHILFIVACRRHFHSQLVRCSAASRSAVNPSLKTVTNISTDQPSSEVCAFCLPTLPKFIHYFFFRWENALKNELQLNFWIFAPSSNGRRDFESNEIPLFFFLLLFLTLVSFFSLCANCIPVGDW